MLITDLPTRIPEPFANTGSKNSIPDTSASPAASWSVGFPPATFLPVGAGGTPPAGKDMNGVLYQTSGWAQWFSVGGPVLWNSAFSTTISGYPDRALVQGTTRGTFYVNTTDANTSNPNSGGAGWVNFSSYILASPTLTGTTSAPTPSGGDNSTKIATTAFVTTAVAAGVSSAVSTANSFTSTSLAAYLPLIGGTLTGTLNVGDGSGGIATNINGASGTVRAIRWQTNGSTRMVFELDSTAEGVGTGSIPKLISFDNTGTIRGEIFNIDRFGCVLNFDNPPTVPNGTYPASATNPTGVPNYAYVDNIPGFGSGASGGRSYHSVASGGFGTNRTNTHAFDIFVSCSVKSATTNDNLQALVSGVMIANQGQVGTGSEIAISFFVPAGAVYKVQTQTTTPTNIAWYEYY